MSKNNIDLAARTSAVKDPYYTNEMVASTYASLRGMDVTSTQAFTALEGALEKKGIPTANSQRASMTNTCQSILADLGKEVADLPLTPADVGAAANDEQHVEPEAFKTFALETNMDDQRFDLMFEVLTELRSIWVEGGQKVSILFDGYFSVEFVCWYLMQIALEKKLVRIALQCSIRIVALSNTRFRCLFCKFTSQKANTCRKKMLEGLKRRYLTREEYVKQPLGNRARVRAHVAAGAAVGDN